MGELHCGNRVSRGGRQIGAVGGKDSQRSVVKTDSEEQKGWGCAAAEESN